MLNYEDTAHHFIKKIFLFFVRNHTALFILLDVVFQIQVIELRCTSLVTMSRTTLKLDILTT